MLVYGTIEVAFLSAPEAENLIHVPPPFQSSPIGREGLGQWRAEGLYPMEHGACRDIDMALREQLHDMGS